jgi:hypothetical protein
VAGFLSGVQNIEGRLLAFGGHAKWTILVEQSEATRQAFSRTCEGHEWMKMLDVRSV